MPSEEWKMKYYHEKWYAGETISVGIGQGAIAATPIQMLRAIAGIASGGALKRPHVVPYDEMPEEMLAQLKTEGSGDVNIPIAPGNWEIVTDGMAAVTEPGGTAASAHLEGIDFAGKTGSAQTISNELKARMGGGGVKLRDNAWFVGVSPRRNPEIAVCILWENGMEGYFSARRAARVVEAYVEKQRRLEGNLRLAAAPTSPSPTQPSGTNPGPPPRPTTAPAAAPKPSDTAKLAAPSNKIEMAAIWSDNSTGAGKFTGGHFDLPAPDAQAPAAPPAPKTRPHHVPPVAMAVR
jgi:penicillin-binding protein 2